MAKKTPICNPDAHRAVNWNEAAIQQVINEAGYVLVGLKLDGMRCHLYRTGDNHENVVAVTRAGHEILSLRNRYPDIIAQWDALGFSKGCVIDTELLLPGQPVFQDASGMLRRHAPLPDNEPVQFVILDVYRSADLLKSDGDTPSYGHRLTSIARKLDGRTHLDNRELSTYTDFVGEAVAKCGDMAQVRYMYALARRRCLEGIIVKDPRATVRNGKVAGQWKLKPGNGAPGWEGDGVVIDYVWGEVGKANEGKIVGFRVRLEDGGEVNATGLTQAQIAEYTHEWERFDPRSGRHSTKGAYMDRIARIEAMEKTASGSLRHPKFCGFRDLDSVPGVVA